MHRNWIEFELFGWRIYVDKWKYYICTMYRDEIVELCTTPSTGFKFLHDVKIDDHTLYENVQNMSGEEKEEVETNWLFY